MENALKRIAAVAEILFGCVTGTGALVCTCALIDGGCAYPWWRLLATAAAYAACSVWWWRRGLHHVDKIINN